MDHDQRFKVLLKEFFPEFILLCLPEWAGRFDFAHLDWLDKEVFTDPPQGERRTLDLVARLPTTQPLALPRGGPPESWIALLHVEIESEDSVAPLRRRVFDYREQLRRDHGLPVLSMALYLRVGLDGIGWDVYEEYFWDRRVLHFEYPYVGLPALDGEQYATGDNLLAVALSALMRIAEQRRAELRVQALQRVADSRENDYRRFLLAECVQAYWPLDEAQWQEYQRLLLTDRYKGAQAMVKTAYEQGIETGRHQGRREMLQMQLEARFGPLSPQALERLQALSLEQLRDLALAFVRAQSLQELGLEV
jgi:hypothetical protein